MTYPPQPPWQPGNTPSGPWPGSTPSPGYGSFPSQPTPATDPGPAPLSVSIAIALLCIRVALSLTSLFFIDEALDRMLASPQLAAFDPATLNTLKQVVFTASLAITFIWGAVWVLFIVKAGQGRNWARVVLTIFLSIDAVFLPLFILEYVQGVLAMAQLVFTVPGQVLGLLVIVLFWLPASQTWYDGKTAFRKARRAQPLTPPPTYPGG